MISNNTGRKHELRHKRLIAEKHLHLPQMLKITKVNECSVGNAILEYKKIP
jgi:hypothetical protein